MTILLVVIVLSLFLNFLPNQAWAVELEAQAWFGGIFKNHLPTIITTTRVKHYCCMYFYLIVPLLKFFKISQRANFGLNISHLDYYFNRLHSILPSFLIFATTSVLLSCFHFHLVHMTQLAANGSKHGHFTYSYMMTG